MIIIPTWKRFKSWNMPNRFAYVVGVITIIGIISSFFIKNSTNNVDLSTTNNKTESSTTNIFIEKVEDENKVDNSLVYSILGVKNKKLEKLIKDSMKISFINNAANNIEISYTGQVQLLSNNSESYIYTGGFINLTINSNTCYEFENYKIPAMRANPKPIILNELKRVINLYVEQNVNEFSKKIIQCLKN